jgi:ankyrin repeat protein
VRLLLENGADVDGKGGIALEQAAASGNETIVKQLLEHGADVNAGGAWHLRRL